MIADLPARWHREASECWDLAAQRHHEGRDDDAHRLVARATTWQRAADELATEPDFPHPGGTAHA